MTASFAVAVAVLGPLIGLVHSSFAKSYGLAVLYPDSDVKRRIIMLIWHLPSLVWAALALAILMARLSGSANLPMTLVAVFVYGISGLGNLWAHKKPFIGGVLLIFSGLLVSMDWIVNS
jgi:hypothetical protein